MRLIVILLASVAAAAPLGLPKAYNYSQWDKVATAGLPSSGPHAGQTKVVYANKVASAAWKTKKPLPVGSIVTKTAGPAATPTLIAIMEKRSSGWYYEEYLPEGGRYVLKFGGPGQQQACAGCHTGAKAKDYLFTRP
jgi:hypothetical protein